MTVLLRLVSIGETSGEQMLLAPLTGGIYPAFIRF
jgi:hypothetical protein